MGGAKDSKLEGGCVKRKRRSMCSDGSTAFLEASTAAMEEGEADFELCYGDWMLSQESSEKRECEDDGQDEDEDEGWDGSSCGASSLSPWSGQFDSQETVSVSDVSVEETPEVISQQMRKKERKTRTGAFDHLLDPKECIWEPPVSPHGLIEELLYWDPWKLLVACILLNKTTGIQVRGVIWSFFRRYPSPQDLLEEEDASRILQLIEPLGLGRKRTSILQKFSDEYLQKDWVDPIVLHGIGKYASDAYFIFCRGQWKEVQPDDRMLQLYVDWLSESSGLGYGATRDPIPIPQDKWKAFIKEP